MSQTLVFAHRGASRDAPENTLAAFQEAWRQGADGIEGDYHLTSDHQVVCIHDEDTLRTGGQKLVVCESSLDQLRTLEYGLWKGPKFQGQTLPTVQDVMATLPKASDTQPNHPWVILELKTGPEIVGPLTAALHKTDVDFERLLIIAFDEATIAESKRVLPSVKAHWLTDYRWDENQALWRPTVDEIIEAIRRCGADGLGSENRCDVVTREMVSKLTMAGIREFHVWTVDLPAEAIYYQSLGAMAVTSNCPGMILAAFHSQPCHATRR